MKGGYDLVSLKWVLGKSAVIMLSVWNYLRK
jgi:hypothetical protein